MKNVAIILITVLIIVSLFSFPLTASAQTEMNYDAYDIYEVFSTSYRQRFAGSVGESNAAMFIARKLSEYGYVSVDGGNDYLQTFNGEFSIPNTTTNEFETYKFTSSNVVGYKRSGKENSKLLVLGCAYDNGYGYYNIKNEGAYESSTAVAALLSVAKTLRTAELDFDVAFAFFGADYFNFLGATSFLETNKESILGYINLDAVGGGDDLYIYYDDVNTAHGKLIDGVISKFAYDVKGAPFNKGIYSLSNEYADRPYFHKGLNSSNYVFMEKDIPSVHLFGYNWAELGGGESSEHADILGTENDTFEYMNDQYGKDFIANRINLASSVVSTVVLQNADLASAFEKYDNSYTALYSIGVYSGISFALIVLVIVLFIVGYVLASKKTKQAGNPDFSTNSMFLNGNGVNVGSTRKDDVFNFGEGPIVSDNNNKNTRENSSDSSDDDIFGEF